MLLTYKFDRTRELVPPPHSVVLPGDPLEKGKISVCLTFDNAWFDIYHSIFPILKRHQIRAVVGVPTRYILDSTSLPPEERLGIPTALAMQDGFFDQKVPLCTWEELDEMVNSGLVEVASQSHMHCNLTFDFVDFNREVVLSKAIIESNLSQPVHTFIYPFGRTNKELHAYVSEHYAYAFRTGEALNYGWSHGAPINRVTWTPSTPLSYWQLMKHRFQGLLAKHA